MSAYLAEIWRYRYFWLSLVRADLRTRYRRSVLGIGWSLLHPIAMTAVLCTVFHKLFGLDIREYGPSLLAGIAFWNFLTAVTIGGCQCLFQGEQYIRQHPLPIAIFPLRTVLGAAFHFLMALAVVIVLRWCLSGIGSLAPLASLAPGLVLILLFGWSVAVLTGFTNAYFPDTHHLSEVGLQILFYGTPIIWPAEMVREKGLGWIVDYNPLAAFVQLIREPVLAGHVPLAHTFAVATVTTLVLFGTALLILARSQQKIVFQL